MVRFDVDLRLQTPIELHAVFEIRGFTALLGRSGAGKTSLLKALAGLLPSTGTPWAGLPPQARSTGYLPQSAALFPHLNVLENTAYALRGGDRFAGARGLLGELGIGELALRPATALSGGEAQRVALARALARAVELMLLDEPSAALDATTRDATLNWLIDTLSARQIPALAATHDPAVAGLADWVALLAGGRIIQQGTPSEVFGNPGSVAAAELLGFENIWAEGGCFYAIRAAEIEIAKSGMPARVVSARAYGAGLRVECAAPHRMVVLVKAGEFQPGAEIYLRFSEAALKRING
jgi:ABC-type Fe3+/spermidine/putrescine transport system ATPase subunit